MVTVGGEDDEEILRREMAMGANQGVLISDEAFSGSDARGIATILKGFVRKGNYDLILTGVQAEDGGAQVGGMLAAMLDYPFASLVNSIEVLEGRKLKVSREIEGGNKEMNEINLPCVLSIQTGINEPRYVGMRGIRAVASVPIPTFGVSDLGVDPGAVGEAAAKVKRVDYFVPALGKGAEYDRKRDQGTERIGVSNSSIETQGYSLSANYANCYSSCVPSITGYTVTNGLQVNITSSSPSQLGLQAGRVIDTSVGAGTNQISLSFVETNSALATLTNRALQQAVTSAYDQAQVIAGSLGVSTTGVISASEGTSYTPYYGQTTFAAAVDHSVDADTSGHSIDDRNCASGVCHKLETPFRGLPFFWSVSHRLLCSWYQMGSETLYATIFEPSLIGHMGPVRPAQLTVQFLLRIGISRNCRFNNLRIVSNGVRELQLHLNFDYEYLAGPMGTQTYHKSESPAGLGQPNGCSLA